MDSTTDRGVLEAKLLPELQQIAQTIGVEGAQKLRKAGLIDAIVAKSGSGQPVLQAGSMETAALAALLGLQ